MFERLRTKKDPYTPSATKRYEVSPDEFSRKRIQALKDIHHQLEAELGFPISFSIYGSLTKGKPLTPEIAERADIDMRIDLDRETLPTSRTILEFEEELKKKVILAISNIKGELGYAKLPPIRHLSVRTLDNQSINEALSEYLKPSLLKRNKVRIERKIMLATFFTLSIGNVVKKYRNQLLNELSNIVDQDKAESIWQTIRTVVERVEGRSKAIPEQIQKQFPQTLEEALKFYGIKTTTNEKPE